MLLAVDVGNTQTVVGAYGEEGLLHMWRLSTARGATPDELRLSLLSLASADGQDVASVSGLALASVVPSLRQAWRAVGAALGVSVVQATPQAAEGFLDMSAYPGAGLGEDRVADAVAAYALYGGPVVVVDFGTATNIEVVDGAGRFLGGIIAPGVETSMRALFSSAAQLPAVDLTDPGTAIGKNTQQSMQVGIVYGEAARIEGLLRRIADELGGPVRAVATGGLAQAIAPMCPSISIVNPELTLQGLRILFRASADAAAGAARA